MKKTFPKSCFFVSLPSDSLQFQKHLMTKFEMCLGFKPEVLSKVNLNLFLLSVHVAPNFVTAINLKLFIPKN